MRPPDKTSEPIAPAIPPDSSPSGATISYIGHRALYVINREFIPYNESQLLRLETHTQEEGFRRSIGPYFRVPIDCLGREEQIECIQKYDSELKIADVGALIEGTFREQKHKIRTTFSCIFKTIDCTQ